jgi:transcriptional regulator with XRE-family HTH domain
VAEDRADGSEPVVNLGARLKHHRQLSGLSLRELARQLGVSPSFVSQLENSKSQPSVATLYSISQLLDVSIDELFSTDELSPPAAHAASPGADAGTAGAVPLRAAGGADGLVNRSDLGSPADAWPNEKSLAKLCVTRPGARARLEMDSGVVWIQLATNTGPDLDFIEVIYPPHSTSTNDNRMLLHAGSEFGYLIEGQLEITVGFEVHTLDAGDAFGFDSSRPHLFANRTDRPARGIWYVRHITD